MSTAFNSEKICIATAMWDPEIVTQLKPEQFSVPQARLCWQALIDLHSRNMPIDPHTLEMQLEKNLGNSVGEWAPLFIAESGILALESNQSELHAQHVRDQAMYRRVIGAIADISDRARRETVEPSELLSDSIAALAAIAVDDGKDPTLNISRVLRNRIKGLEEMFDRKAAGEDCSNGAPTGVAALDAHTGGWPFRIVSIIAARPGMGKSSLGLATANACVRREMGVHVFSLEDSGQAYADRAIAQTQNIPAENIRSLDMKRATMQALSNSVSDLHGGRKWLFDDTSGLSADDIVMRVRKHAKANKTQCVIVDYIQLLKFPRGASSTHEALGKSITTLADAAKADNMAYVVMSQLNRGIENRADKLPMMSDLRESGSLEERAKLIVGLYRDAYYNPNTANPSEVDILILKNSNGTCQPVKAGWHGPTMRMW